MRNDMPMDDAGFVLSVSEFVALTNQVFESAFPSVSIRGELANFRISKNRWVYFDLKDESATVRFFGTIYVLPGPLEDGMLLTVRGTPRLHALYGFSVTIASIQLQGEGTIKRAAELLRLKLEKEGLFEPGRKRSLPYPPEVIGLITSKQSAAYADFTKILQARWPATKVEFIDVQVQGEIAPSQLVSALNRFSLSANVDVVVMTRGGGSAEDLVAFNDESVVRAVASCRVPTLVAIGHEIDESLAEMAADRRASTPSNAAELLVPDRLEVLRRVRQLRVELDKLVDDTIRDQRTLLSTSINGIRQYAQHGVALARTRLLLNERLLRALSPEHVLRRGFAIVRTGGTLASVARSVRQLPAGAIVDIELADGHRQATVAGNQRPTKGA